MSLALTSLGPLTSTVNFCGLSEFKISLTPFKFRTSSTTSSAIPERVENWCLAPAILTWVTAAPGKEPKSVLLKEFPSVWPNPWSKGSIINLPKSAVSFSVSISKSDRSSTFSPPFVILSKTRQLIFHQWAGQCHPVWAMRRFCRLWLFWQATKEPLILLSLPIFF